jgi:hypothetical protein
VQCNVGELLPPEGSGQLFSERAVKIHQFEACRVEEGRRPRQAIDYDLLFNHQHFCCLVEAPESAIPIVLDPHVLLYSTLSQFRSYSSEIGIEEPKVLVKSSSILFIYRTTKLMVDLVA